MVGGIDLNRFAGLAWLVVGLCLNAAAPARAQSDAVNELKVRISDAKTAQQTFANGLKHCSELDGKHFYFVPRDRVFDLEEYHRSLESLARQGAFNPDKHQPWNEQDAAERWDQAQREAVKDKDYCQLVASLPLLQKALDELQQKASQTSEKKN
jgi:hypothetical protein